MKNALLKAGKLAIAVMILVPKIILSQSLSWSASFSPGWVDGSLSGTASNIAGSNINLSASVTLSGGAFTSSGGFNTPTVSGTSTIIAGSTTRLVIAPNFTTSTQYANTTLTFSQVVSSVSFRIADIDKQNANSNSYYDQVTITGSDGTNTYYPTLTKYDPVTDPNFLIISGNVAHANTTNGQGGKTNSNASDQKGTITVAFGNVLLTSVTIHLDNATGVQANPGIQTIAIGEFSFINPILPVKLLSFSASQNNQDVLLKWVTAQETNSDLFEIQRSTSGDIWQTITRINAAGNSVMPVSYSCVDPSVSQGMYYYRLKEVDKDGRYSYSPVIRINNSSIAKFTSYPNPFTNSFNIQLFSQSEQTISVIISDMAGRRINTSTHNLSRGNNTFNITAPDKLANGPYHLYVLGDDNRLLWQTSLIKN